MKQKILLVEDDLYIREVYQEILTDGGFETDTAVDGEEGLLKIKNGGYNLILLDLMMPKLDGIEVLKNLKQSQTAKANGPIILLTNLAHESVIKEAEELGAKSYMSKSDLNPDQLLEKVKSFLS